jgi:CheY-like chemotaxis protein
MIPAPTIILAADDDLEDLDLIEDAIRKFEPDAIFHKVTNGKAVIEFLEVQPDSELPCLIIVDYNMPELNGAEVLAQICVEPRYEKIPKVVLSTSSAKLHIHECMNNGATEYFIKPDNVHELHATVKKKLSYCGSG